MKVALSLIVSSMVSLAAGTEPKTKLPNSRADLLRGEKLFQVHCSLCHGPKGEGGRGPLLTRAKLSRAPDEGALLKILEDGIRGTEMPGSPSLSDRELRQTAAYVRSLGKVALRPVPGDVVRGAEIYRGKGGCAGCHSVRGEGGVAGPDLSVIGESRSAAFLRESIVNPGAAVPEGYLLVTVVPTSGPSVTGLRVNEDSFSIQLRDAAGRSIRSGKRTWPGLTGNGTSRPCLPIKGNWRMRN
jgi:putative heme-binding domain-containing protein